MAVVAPAVPLNVTSPVAKPMTGSLKTTVKLIGLLLVGSAWPDAWLMAVSYTHLDVYKRQHCVRSPAAKVT